MVSKIKRKIADELYIQVNTYYHDTITRDKAADDTMKLTVKLLDIANRGVLLNNGGRPEPWGSPG